MWPHARTARPAPRRTAARPCSLAAPRRAYRAFPRPQAAAPPRAPAPARYRAVAPMAAHGVRIARPRTARLPDHRYDTGHRRQCRKPRPRHLPRYRRTPARLPQHGGPVRLPLIEATSATRKHMSHRGSDHDTSRASFPNARAPLPPHPLTVASRMRVMPTSPPRCVSPRPQLRPCRAPCETSVSLPPLPALMVGSISERSRGDGHISLSM